MANQFSRTPVPCEARVLVVGASSGLGCRIAQALMARGLDVVAVAEPRVDQAPPDVQRLLEVPIVRQRLVNEPTLLADFSSAERTPPRGWYQQFAGRRGRPRRY